MQSSLSKFLERDEIVQLGLGEHDLSGYTLHIGNVRAALEWALSDHGDVVIGIALAASAAPLFVGLSLLGECGHWCERALAVLDDPSRNIRREMVLQEALALALMYTGARMSRFALHSSELSRLRRLLGTSCVSCSFSPV